MIHFIVNKQLIQTQIPSGENLLEFIRNHAHFKGTKVGCREGDCGACTVLIGTLQSNGVVEYESVTSCLVPLSAVAGKHVVTVEGLNLDNQLNATQKSMHDHFATQCGFCTPGFAVSFSGFALNYKINYHAVDAVSGNICRCTGYKSIEKAAIEIEFALGTEEHPIEWLVENHFIPDYFLQIPDRLKNLPTSEITSFSRNMAGGTDLYVREEVALSAVNVQSFAVDDSIEIINNKIIFGAGVTISKLLESNVLLEKIPNLKSFLKLVSSQQIRNRATLAGNIVNASPIGDLSVILLALNAQIRLKNPQNIVRYVALKDFFLDYKKMDLMENEFVTHIECEFPEKPYFVHFEKISKRTHLDIASVNMAMLIQSENEVIQKVHLSVGGVAPFPKYLAKTVAFLQDKSVDKEIFKEAANIIQSEITPIDDIRGSVAYKRLLARQLFWVNIMRAFPSIITKEIFIELS